MIRIGSKVIIKPKRKGKEWVTEYNNLKAKVIEKRSSAEAYEMSLHKDRIYKLRYDKYVGRNPRTMSNTGWFALKEFNRAKGGVK